jgi:hypothetical protein
MHTAAVHYSGHEEVSHAAIVRENSGWGEPPATQGKGKQFFFEKKNQKTFDPWGARWVQRARQWTKVFASFSKKKRFLASSGSAATPTSVRALVPM